jgi:hypothetical protein
MTGMTGSDPSELLFLQGMLSESRAGMVLECAF